MCYLQILLLEGMQMTSKDYWQVFMETGAPEMYLLYQQARKLEENHVSDHPGDRPAGYGLQ